LNQSPRFEPVYLHPIQLLFHSFLTLDHFDYLSRKSNEQIA
jgi:hypothetical protein